MRTSASPPGVTTFPVKWLKGRSRVAALRRHGHRADAVADLDAPA